MSSTTSQFKIAMTPETAKQWLNDYHYEYQRPVRNDVVVRYAEAMKRGEWKDNGETVILASVNGNGKRVAVDGWHRLSAVALSGVTIPLTVNEVKCDSEADLAEVYFTIDRNRTRSMVDTYRTMQIWDEIGVTKTWINTAGAALQFANGNFLRSGTSQARYLSSQEMLASLRHHAQAIRLYAEANHFAEGAVANGVRRAATAAVGIMSLHYASSVYGELKVLEFWEGIARDDGLRRGDPRKTAHTHLTSTTHSALAAKSLQVVSPPYTARYVAQCFNAWVEGRTFSDSPRAGWTKVYDASAPIKINGTPWKG